MRKERLEITEVKQHLDEWRSSRAKQGPIPENLWMEVLSLIGRYKSSALSKEFGISSHQIKNKMTEVADKEFELVKQAHFAKAKLDKSSKPDNVVHIQPQTADARSHDIEISRPDGSTLRVSDVPQAEVKAIITAFIS